MEFPGWTDQESIKAYISRVQKCLLDDESKLALDEHLPQEAVDMLFEKFAGRFRPAIFAMVCPFACRDELNENSSGIMKHMLDLYPLCLYSLSTHRKGLSSATI